MAEKELGRIRPEWERRNVIPTRVISRSYYRSRPRSTVLPRWADMFSPRQLLCFGVLVENSRNLNRRFAKEREREGKCCSKSFVFRD